MAATIGETVQQLHDSLRDYIEATYHVSHPTLVTQRQQILQAPGVIHQQPYLESTPRYKSGLPFKDLGLHPAVLEVFSAVSQQEDDLGLLIHDPPYQHQAESVKLSLVEGRSLVVMTGTGSGKTECFLLPILGKLASAAAQKGRGFGETAAVRAMALYPMNALVNDQLGRLRLLFADSRICDKFTHWCGRPARFARYTSRTLYPGVRDARKDQAKLSPIRDYYVKNLELAQDSASSGHAAADALVRELKKRGKWPAKPDLAAWYGRSGTRWQDRGTQEFRRCVTLPEDTELFTRHEVQAAPPDILVTNYSMLEYMLMRPLERPIFDKTRDWLEANPDERFLLVIDEAHLYRGAAGAEVALLIRRLRTRLGIPPERLQVICTSASMKDPDYAIQFASQLTGKDASDFSTIQGDLLFRTGAGRGTSKDAVSLEAIDLGSFYEAETDAARLSEVQAFLQYRQIAPPWELNRSLHDALVAFPPMVNLINTTMEEARPVANLGESLFDGVPPDVAARATTNLIALASTARLDPTQPGLMPCRVHSFFRGLPGLWVCMDPNCTELSPQQRGGPSGKLFGQPRDVCECAARVLELFTCRNCGTAYGRAYTNNVEEPDFLWPESGAALQTRAGTFGELDPVDLLLEAPVFTDRVEPADYDLLTGRLNPIQLGDRVRQVYLRANRASLPDVDGEPNAASQGEFRPCAVCGESAAYGRSSVQDHQTKGDQPFQALIAKQIQVQPPGPAPATKLAPLRGRKVLIFSDSRQMAARLAPNLQTYSTQDVLRPLIVTGFARLTTMPIVASLLSLEDLYLGVLIAAKVLGVRLRPELRSGETFQDEHLIEQAVDNGALDNDATLLQLLVSLRSSAPPESLLRATINTISDRYYGLESLALASFIERSELTSKITDLPDVPGHAESNIEKLALGRAWLRCWTRPGIWLSRMPASWWLRDVRSHSGKFRDIRRLLSDRNSLAIFERQWLPNLLETFAEPVTQRGFRLKGRELSLDIGGIWAYCQSCRTAQRPFPGKQTCVHCGHEAAEVIDPDTDQVFVARKGYYRASTLEALREPPIAPMALIAAEHTAQINSAQENDIFSKAEEHELLFQDVNLGPEDTGRDRPAIDVLSCTTTMEVGIDIGALSGVALRNMPPARANYQQRAGRAGRRGNAVATVTAFGSADSHDEHHFEHPDLMIRGAVEDPTLTLNNPVIARRHVTAYLLQRYHHARLPEISAAVQPHLFAVLGTVVDFKNPTKTLNRVDFEQWLNLNELALHEDVGDWLPKELGAVERQCLLGGLIDETLNVIDEAIQYDSSAADGNGPLGEERDVETLETQEEVGEEASGRDPTSENLLDRLLYKAVLPRYAFPTDVVAFHVFDQERSTHYRHAFRFTPSQGLPAALSQYAPGKEVWIDSKLWTSGAVYSPIQNDRYDAWQKRRLYYECKECRYASTGSLEDGQLGETKDCVGCGGIGTFGQARNWLKPPGFAHPVYREEGTSPDDQPARSYATRAKLAMPTPADPAGWLELTNRLRVYNTRPYLLVTNRGPRDEGYSYCTRCGLIEPTASSTSEVGAAHRKPYPDPQDSNCPGGRMTTGLTLGTDFITDVLLVSISVDAPLSLLPRLLATDVALRTLSEALTIAACRSLELDSNELQTEYRPALTPAGREGREAEIYLYDTLPGGAGFAERAGRLGLTIFEEALQILETCTENCDRSCYRCLRSYKNKFEHELLDRHLGASLLRYLIHGKFPTVNPGRVESSTTILFEDLKRQGFKDLTVRMNYPVALEDGSVIMAPIYLEGSDGRQFIIGLHGPLTPDVPFDAALGELRGSSNFTSVFLYDEILVRRNLPSATNLVIEDIGKV